MEASTCARSSLLQSVEHLQISGSEVTRNRGTMPVASLFRMSGYEWLALGLVRRSHYFPVANGHPSQSPLMGSRPGTNCNGKSKGQRLFVAIRGVMYVDVLEDYGGDEQRPRSCCPPSSRPEGNLTIYCGGKGFVLWPCIYLFRIKKAVQGLVSSP